MSTGILSSLSNFISAMTYTNIEVATYLLLSGNSTKTSKQARNYPCDKLISSSGKGTVITLGFLKSQH